MDLLDYIAETSRTYHFRIKTVVPLDDALMDRIEFAVAKYRPLDISRPKKTLLQKNPLDFINVENAEVYVIDLVTGLPASSYVMQQELRNAINCSEKYIVVRGDNEPIEIESEKLDAEREMNAEAEKDGLRRDGLLNDPTYAGEGESAPGEEVYGDKYNMRLLDYLRMIQQTRTSEKREPANPLFTWLEMPKETDEPKQDGADFNKGIEGVKPASTRPKVTATKIDPNSIRSRSIQGNFDDNDRTYRRKYVTANGKTKVLTKTVDAVRKEK